jgi:hypothetical protein
VLISCPIVRIRNDMGMRSAVVSIMVVASIAPVYAVDGTFQGKVVAAPADAPVVPGWIYVQGRNHLLRRVEVAQAEIVFSSAIPEKQRGTANPGRLVPGTEVLITARQDRAGKWHAKRVEILKLIDSVNKAERNNLDRRVTRDSVFVSNPASGNLFRMLCSGGISGRYNDFTESCRVRA